MKTSNDVKKTIRSRMELLGYTNQEMACRMHMSLSSWNRRMRNPAVLNVRELIRIEAVLKFKLLVEGGE